MSLCNQLSISERLGLIVREVSSIAPIDPRTSRKWKYVENLTGYLPFTRLPAYSEVS